MNTFSSTVRGDFHRMERAQPRMLPMNRDMSVAQRVEEARQSAVLQERRRIAREIHDTLAQTLTAILVHLRAADQTLADLPGEARAHLAQVAELTGEGLAEVRRTVLGLRTQALEAGDLFSALQRSIARITAGTGLDVRFQERGIRTPLPPEAEEELLRIAQEALTNVVRHAHARRVQIQLVYQPTQVRLCIQDDGRGFDSAGTKQGHFGLVGMRERSARLGAALTIESAPERGTKIVVALDLGRTRVQ